MLSFVKLFCSHEANFTKENLRVKTTVTAAILSALHRRKPRNGIHL